jgi:hypothetical protein
MAEDLDRVIDALNTLIGEEVHVTLRMVMIDPEHETTLEGRASWAHARPSCGPAFLRIDDDSGIPVGGHGCRGVELVQGGVRWRDAVAEYTVVAARR